MAAAGISDEIDLAVDDLSERRVIEAALMRRRAARTCACCWLATTCRT
jgi:hypothetical protein